MRKISSFSHFVMLSAIAAAIFMASCIKDEVVDVPFIPTESETIGFGVASDWGEYEDVTRSGVALNRIGKHELKSADGEFTLPMGVYVEDGIRSANADKAETRGAVLSAIGDSFTVWASLANGDTSTLFFDAEGVVFENDGTSYKSDPAYFWPGAGTLNFTAVANAPASGFVPNLNAAGTALESFTYTVPQDATAQNDIVLATASVGGANNATVPLNFKHIMTAVNVQVGSISAGTIESITLKGVYNKGTYNVATRKWTVDTSSTENYSVKFAGGGDSFTTTGNQTTGTSINANDATFMFIPQEPGAGAIMEVVFTNANNETETTTASIEGDIWDMGKTVNYRISIDESFTLTVEPTGKKLDAHYIMTTVNVTVKDIPSWQITATANDNAEVTILPYDEVNALAKEGFWTDKEVDANGVEGSSARGTNSYSGNGDITEKPFVVFIPENISDADRQISIILSSTTVGSTATTTKVLLQKYPNWTAGGFGWEVVDDDESGKYGFKWTRKVAYIYPYSWTISDTKGHEDFVKDFVSSYGADANGFATVVRYIHSGSIITQKRYYILLDYTKLNNVTGADSATEGYNNTLALYRQAGTTATSQFETILKTTKKTESGKEGEDMFRLPNEDEVSSGKVPAESGQNNDLSAIMEYIQKKNRYYLQKKSQTDSDGNTIVSYVPIFFESDLKWYLPAYGQFEYFNPDPNVANDAAANYWSSTTAGTTTAWTGGKEEKDRDLEYRVIAVRRDENGYGTVAVTVDNSEMAGGENGEAQWVN